MARNSNGESVFSRMARLYEAFDPESPAITVSELSKRAGLPMPTVSRMVSELVEHDWLLRDGDGRVRIGFRVWELVTRAGPTRDLCTIAMPCAGELHAHTGQHVCLGVRRGDEVLVVEKLTAPGAAQTHPEDPRRLPLHGSSTGLVLLANASFEDQQGILGQALPAFTAHTPTSAKSLRLLLSEVRRSGFAVCAGFVNPALTGVSVPVRSCQGEVVAALTVVMPNSAGVRSVIPRCVPPAPRSAGHWPSRAPPPRCRSPSIRARA
ncbi:IclR family transcriptional regulator [Nocardia gipuzkoensis]|uniref:IclR family transcriptional regulator n=1 Tax=Nocardia gipuzkoensis TaxID=2749991 RepID=UPI003EE03833